MGSIPIVGSVATEQVGWSLKKCRSLACLQLAFLGGYPSGQRGLTVNQLAEAFGGSNPSPPTGCKAKNPENRCLSGKQALIAQLVEHVLGKNGVMSSNLIEGSSCRTKSFEHI
jgi:hypothetical protein